MSRVQAPAAVVLIRPHHFHPNPLTARDNTFQTAADRDVSRAAYDAVTTVAERLRAAGVNVHLFEDAASAHPDSVFANNWFSTHSDGRVGVFPMYAANRRGERRADVLDYLKAHYRVQEVVDYSGLEHDDLFLESTGAMVLDHVHRVAYTAQSRRADPTVLQRFCRTFGYEPLLFQARDRMGTPIYHTNVMMGVATEFAMIGLDSIADGAERRVVAQRLEDTGHEVIALSQRQLVEFAGNVIELSAGPDRILAISRRGYRSLDRDQRRRIERTAQLLPLDVTPIELAGGSVRCMIAGIHLEARAVPTHRPLSVAVAS